MVFSKIAGLCGFALVVCLSAAPVCAQERRAVVFGTIGGATLGHADSEQGNAPMFGGGAGYHLTPRLIVDGDVHIARVSHVFGRDDHNFAETMFTASLLFRSSPNAPVHFIAGGGAGIQWAHTHVDDRQLQIDRTDTIRLLHGRVGAEWSLSSRIVLRTEGVLWFGEGLDWVMGARGALGWRF
jgi:hypothetical protein